MQNKKIDKIIDEIYTDLYSECIFLDGINYEWKYVKDRALIVPGDTKKHIPFMGFYLDFNRFDEIVKIHIKGLHNETKNIIASSVYLGPSPTTSIEAWKRLREKYNKFIDEVNENMTLDDISKLVSEDVSSNLVIALKFSKLL